MDKNNWSVYYLLCPDTQIIRYIGISSNPKTRLNSHLTKSNKETCHKAHWIIKLLKEGKKPIMEIVANSLSQKEAKKVEIIMGLFLFLLQDTLITNHLGALGSIGPRKTKESHRLWVERNPEAWASWQSALKIRWSLPETIESVTGANNPFYGKKHSEETKAKLSVLNKEKYALPESNPFYGKHHNPTTKETIRKLAIERMSNQDNVNAMILNQPNRKAIKVWNETNEYYFDGLNIAARTLGLDLAALSRVAHGRSKYHLGYKACFIEHASLEKTPHLED